jgi:quercetin dioxygenase-like cupin family protein
MTVKHVDDISVNEVPAGSGTSMQVLISGEEAPNFALRRFIMEPGGGMPLHTNSVEHEQYVLRGRARVTIGDEEFEVRAGNTVFIPAGVPHSYRSVGEEPFEFLCSVPNEPDTVEILESG